MTETTQTMSIETNKQSPPSPPTENFEIHSIEGENSQKTEVDSNTVGRNSQTDGIGGASDMDIVAKDSDVSLSTNADHMENALVNDYTEAFTTYTLFNSREALVDWVREVGKENDFIIVIKASEAGGGKNNRRPRVRFACERSGKYRKFVKKFIPGEEVKQRPNHRSTKKCGCPFELKAVCDHEGWTLTVVNGMHNHLLARNLEGHSYTSPFTEYKRDDRPIPLSAIHDHGKKLDLSATPEGLTLFSIFKADVDLLFKKFVDMDDSGKIHLMKKVKELVNPSYTSLLPPDVKANIRGRKL